MALPRDRDPQGAPDPGADEPLATPPPASAPDAEGEWEDLTPDFEAAERAGSRPPRSARTPGRGRTRVVAAAIAAVVALAGGLLGYRTWHTRRVVREALARAVPLADLDTAAGYRQAADVLEPVTALDPLQAGSVRAYALAMLFADHRDAASESRAEALLVAPLRAEVVPAWANLAATALAYARREAGDATSFAGRAGDDPRASVLLARTALAAGNSGAALEYAAAAVRAAPRLPAAQALHGDLLRRLRRDGPGARAAYAAALASSPRHPRAAFGLAKLALSDQALPEDAAAALRGVLADPATPAPERGRAALHLAALALRAHDPQGARRALDDAGLDPRARAWAERAAAIAAEARGPYRAVQGAPSSLASASDDDPAVAPFVVPAPPPPPAAAKAAAKAPGKASAKAKPASKATRKASAKQPPRKAKRATSAHAR
jgi:hypothetical protein